MDSEENWTAWGIATMAVVIAIAALMIASGSCAGQDRNEQKIDHLEERIDNLRSLPPIACLVPFPYHCDPKPKV